MLKTPTSELSPRLSIGVPLLVVAIGAWYLSAFLLQNSSLAQMSSAAPVVPKATMASMFSAPGIGVIAPLIALLGGKGSIAPDGIPPNQVLTRG